jgi:hypothetical protein
LEKKKKKGLRIEPQKRDEMNRNNGEEKELLQTTLSVRLNLNEKSSHYSKSRKTTKKKSFRAGGKHQDKRNHNNSSKQIRPFNKQNGTCCTNAKTADRNDCKGRYAFNQLAQILVSKLSTSVLLINKRDPHLLRQAIKIKNKTKTVCVHHVVPRVHGHGVFRERVPTD